MIPESEDVCPLCGATPCDDFHQYWACPKLADSEWSEIANTQYLLPKAFAEVEQMPCLWLRGLLPAGLATLGPDVAPISD